MLSRRKAQSAIEYILLIGAVTAAFLGMRMYAERAVNEKLQRVLDKAERYDLTFDSNAPTFWDSWTDCWNNYFSCNSDCGVNFHQGCRFNCVGDIVYVIECSFGCREQRRQCREGCLNTLTSCLGMAAAL